MSERDIDRLERALEEQRKSNEKNFGQLFALIRNQSTTIAETNVRLAEIAAVCPHQQTLVGEAREDIKKMDARIDEIDKKLAENKGEKSGASWIINLISVFGGAAGAKFLDWMKKGGE